MAITLGAITTLATTIRDAISDAFDNYINTTGGGAPTLIVRTSAPATLITFTLDTTAAFGASSTGVITLDVSPAITAVAGASGAPASYQITDSGGTVVLTGTASGDSVTSGLTYTLSSFTLTTPAS